MTAATLILHRLARPKPEPSDLPLLLIAAHPDDEVLGLGSRLPYLKGLHIVFVTDGAPRDMADAHRLGFATREEYAAARACETDAAAALLEVEPRRIRRLGLVDQEAVLHLDELAESCRALIDELRPAAVLTHAYEGGHPDHDSLALAVHFGCRRLDTPILEFGGYHDPDGSGRIATDAFLPASVPIMTIQLDRAEQARKRQALACYATQTRILQMFRADLELLRVAPRYRFGEPPHPWRPYYEHFVRGLDGQRWRELAQLPLERAGATGVF